MSSAEHDKSTARPKPPSLVDEVRLLDPRTGTVFLAGRVERLEDKVGNLRQDIQSLDETIREEGKASRDTFKDATDLLVDLARSLAHKMIWTLGIGMVLLVMAALALLGVSMKVTLDKEQGGHMETTTPAALEAPAEPPPLEAL